MANSTLVPDYLGFGTHADRPSAPPISSTCVGIYAESDTNTIFWYDWTTTAWVQFAAASPLEVTDGVTTVSDVTEINFTSNATVTSGGAGVADVAISGGGGGGALTLVSTQVASSSATLEWTGLSATKLYCLKWYGLVPATAGATLEAQFGTGVTPTWITAGYFYANFLAGSGGFSANGDSESATSINLSVSGSSSAPGYATGDATIFGESLSGTGGTLSNDGHFYVFLFTGTLPSETMTALRLLASTGDLASGAASLYELST